ncbi:type II toxin-antitoxin system PemK/MazF family toxin [Glycomyces luteolus]|uniref:Type II toxin-antitoxin system PemK/MazF family toxin n=1 Tax=Glycomyces luteolus TaxID=2670330 RepID=A0A9X3PD69_9ACTN|nr:type II toxin-antitoxin system PemK/MazF family toxin [Glycomyces luteolus]MDA1361951.1 type II toxin-antitoxin system PemK/MazF family toxin [Glycomyces luteolus]
MFRGAIFEVRPLGGSGHEQRGKRCCVVIQSDRFACSTVTVAMTSTSAGHAVYRPEVEFLGAKARILTDQIHSLDHGRLGEFKGALEVEELDALDRALMLKLALV